MARYRDGMSANATPERVKTTIHFPADVYQDLLDRVHQERRAKPSYSNSQLVADAVRQYLAAAK